MSENLYFYKGLETNLPKSGIKVGALYHCTDTGNTYRGISATEYELYSSAVGKKTLEDGEIFGDYATNEAIEQYATAFGSENKAAGTASFVTGVKIDASGAPAVDSDDWDDHYWRYNEAIGIGSMVSGMGSVAFSRASKSLGYRTQTGYPPEDLKENYPEGRFEDGVTGGKRYHHAPDTLTDKEKENVNSGNFGQAAVAIGQDTLAAANASFASGGGTKALAVNSTAMGTGTEASGTNGAMAINRNTKASGTSSFAAGIYTEATGTGQTVVGKYNAIDADKAFIVGTGTSKTTSKRFNGFTVDWNGNGEFLNNLQVNNNTTIENNLQINNNATIENDLQINNNATVSKDLQVNNNATISKDLKVNGSFAAGGNGAIAKTGGKAFAIGYGAQANGSNSVAIGSNVIVNKSATFGLGTNITLDGVNAIGIGYGITTGKTGVNGQVVIGSYNDDIVSDTKDNALFTIGGGKDESTKRNLLRMYRLSGKTILNGNLIIAAPKSDQTGTLEVTGATTLNDTLSVKGNTILGDTPTKTGSTEADTLTVNAVSTFNGATTLNNTLTVKNNDENVFRVYTYDTDANQAKNKNLVTIGYSTDLDTNNPKQNTTELWVYGDTKIQNNLKVDGNIILGNVSTGDNPDILTVTAESKFNGNLTVNGASILNNSLTVKNGTTTILYAGTDSNDNDALNDNVVKVGAQLNDAELWVYGDGWFGQALEVEGNTTLGNASTSDTLTVNAVSTFNGATTLKSTLNVIGNTALGGTLGVTGATTLNNILILSSSSYGSANLSSISSPNKGQIYFKKVE